LSIKIWVSIVGSDDMNQSRTSACTSKITTLDSTGNSDKQNIGH